MSNPRKNISSVGSFFTSKAPEGGASDEGLWDGTGEVDILSEEDGMEEPVMRDLSW